MFILVDTNEQSTNPKVVERLLKVFPNLQITPLAFGDMNIIMNDGSILAIERKRAGDFLGSIADGRVFRQVESMSNGAKWCCIIVEGGFSFDENDMTVCNDEVTNWKGASVRGAMMSIQWSGCPIMFTSVKEFPYTVLEVIKFCSKPEIHWQSLGRKRIVTFPPIELKEEIIAAFPGIGLKKARSLFEFAGAQNEGIATLAQAMCWASVLPLIARNSRPEGWGDIIAENFRLALGLQTYEFLEIREDDKMKKEIEHASKKASGKKQKGK